jgi:predicted protein tyrosine phosphatase
MIKRVMVRSRAWMLDFLRSPITYRDLENIEFPVAIISIRDVLDDTTGPRFARRTWPDESPEVLPLHFEDDEFDHTRDDSECGVMTKRQAVEVVAFINKLQSQDKVWTLIVHCVAGICRSGAVGEVAADMVGIPYQEFRRENPQILPNNSVRNLLRRVLRESI